MSEKRFFKETPMFKVEGDTRIAIPVQVKGALDFAKTDLHSWAELVASYSTNESNGGAGSGILLFCPPIGKRLVSKRSVVCKAI
jgi:hypothetical protein